MLSVATAAVVLASAALGSAQAVTGTYPPVPLASKGPYAYPSGIPYKVDTDVGLVRGTQLGYNICNSTTENQQSLCQTSWLNSIDDFCLWAPAEPGHNVGDIEGSMIAWCTKPGHGTRLIPSGALTGVQFMKTPDYVQVVGFFDQTKVNMIAGDYGGEMDPHGADLRGNPMGGILYSDKFTGSPVQAIEWHNFIGSNAFCLKACDPAGKDAKHYCEHIYDRIGCAYNAPNAARDLVFESCDGDNQDFPGVYTAANGTTMTYHQPPESLGPITTIEYTARVPASSNCQTFSSAAIYTGLPTVAATTTSAAATTGAGATTSGPKVTGTTTTSKSTTGTAGASQTTNTTSGASSLTISVFSVACVVLSAFVFA
ncbi:hypothetical protein BDN70DRAFT_811591 [Pholiota conissans]|uniref:Macrofage activating glycoprotein n=1 Tax=Pholiota conissans TaxID=109636 RepID=A0A9P5YY82_9AGAR|nr:hypothetical protein BDN70DRAFT_811591 [Pholiota conissans]